MDAGVTEDQVDLVTALRSLPVGVSWRRFTDSIVRRGDVRSAFQSCALQQDLLADGDWQVTREAARADLEHWRRQGWRVVSILDAAFPERVRAIHEVPPLLFYAGHLRAQDRGVAVVGSRNASPRGVDMSRSVAAELAARGLTVVSGLARGIDGAAHEAALDAGARTVAFIGTGLDRSYPSEHAALQQRIADTGVVLSQFWPGSPPRREHFPQRNALMSGYSYATVVVEAGEHSGARIQARMAVAHGRPVILSTLVVERTQWGPTLVGRPDVHTASSLEEVLRLVDDIVERDRRADELLDALSGPSVLAAS
ncbi:MAG: DNA-processing protein DprA [Kineosporiaceae bacterium]